MSNYLLQKFAITAEPEGEGGENRINSGLGKIIEIRGRCGVDRRKNASIVGQRKLPQINRKKGGKML